MGNYSNKENKYIGENKTEFILTNNIIMDVLIFYNYEKKYESISSKNYGSKEMKHNNYIFVVCGLIDGFIEIFNISNNKFKLIISFQAHRDIISKMVQLQKTGFLLTSSFDNSMKIFKLTNNCNKETLIYVIHLNPVYYKINDIIEMSFNNNIIISVKNNIINFPLIKNKLSEEKYNLNDYNFSKYEHQYNYLNKLLEIDNYTLVALNEIKNKLLFFQLTYNKEVTDDISLIKIIEIKDNPRNYFFTRKISIECLRPKYNCILVSDNINIIIIDIKYLEIVSIFKIKENYISFIASYNQKNNRILIFDIKSICKYKIIDENKLFEIEKEEEKSVNIDYIVNLNEFEKKIYSSLNENKIIVFYKKILMEIDLKDIK